MKTLDISQKLEGGKQVCLGKDIARKVSARPLHCIKRTAVEKPLMLLVPLESKDLSGYSRDLLYFGHP